jgi:AraC-like DNA-binding protein
VGFFVHYETRGAKYMLAAALAQDFHSNNLKTFNKAGTCAAPTCEIEQDIVQPPTYSVDTYLQDPLRGSQSPGSETMQHRLQIFLSKHLRDRVTLKDLSAFLGYSQKYCSEFFRLHMGVCFSHYVKNLRITKATGMLLDHDLPLSHIAELLGFSDSFAFSHFFKRAMGCSPSEFRKEQTVHLGFR